MQKQYKYLTAAAASIASAGLLLTNGAIAATVFTDVPPSHWAYNSVQWASQYGIMMGPGNNNGFFNAAGFANRAEIATILFRHHNMVAKDLADLRTRVEQLEEKIEDMEDGNNGSTSSQSNTQRNFRATITPSQETGTVTSNASGNGSFTLTGNDMVYDITVSNLNVPITGAHFHLGAPGVSGPVIEPISFNGYRAVGTWRDMSSAEISDLLAGRIYVNIHTARYPDGEIRGQVTAGTATSSAAASSVRSSAQSSAFSSAMSSANSSLASSAPSTSSASSAGAGL